MRHHYYLLILFCLVLSSCTTTKPWNNKENFANDQYYNPNCTRPSPPLKFDPNDPSDFNFNQQDGICNYVDTK